MPNRNLSGWKRQAYDSRDLKHDVPRRILATLPNYYDVSAGMGNLLDQGSLGSCGPNTAAECISFDEKAEGMYDTGASRLFIYYTTRFLMGTVSQDSGVDNRTMMKALNGYGYPPEALYPYDVSKFTQKPPQNVVDAAAKNKITSYAAVTQQLDQMKGTIVGGRPFVFGFDVFQQMESAECSKTGILAEPSGTPIGGHDVTIVGFSNVQRPGVKAGNVWPANTFKFRNHWTNEDGSPWGDGGYGYIPYDYATGSNASDFWVINAVPGASPSPPNPPTPQPQPPAPPTPQPEPIPVNYVGYVQTPIGKWPIALVPAAASSAPKLSIPPELWTLLFQYGSKAFPVVLADLPLVLAGQKKWADVVKDVIAAVLAA